MARHRHLFPTGVVTSARFKTPPQGGGPGVRIPPRQREDHGARLLQRFEGLWQARQANRQEREAQGFRSANGTYIQFESREGYDLVTRSLENMPSGIRLLNVQTEGDGELRKTKALVYVPRGKEDFFVRRVEAYRSENYGQTDRPKNKDLVESIEDVRLALLEAAWTDSLDLLPGDDAKWCEAWLNVTVEGVQEQVAQFFELLNVMGVDYKREFIQFPERAVVLIKANASQLFEALSSSDLLAEFRSGQKQTGFLLSERADDQAERVQNFLDRLDIAEEHQCIVCILDTGVNNGHPMLEPILADRDLLSIDPNWGTDDHYRFGGHGTLIAGLAGYGPLESVLQSADSIEINHRLCSVKILPPPNEPASPEELWGDLTSQGVYRAEAARPGESLLYCLANNAEIGTKRGRPSSWSGALDNLAFGTGQDKRLLIASAGNMEDHEVGVNYPNSNLLSSVKNPAQSWNVVTVGGYTERVHVADVAYQNHQPIAETNQLSPFSTTSTTWESQWPVKPDLVFEAGNLLKSPEGTVTGHNDLSLLSTSKRFQYGAFETLNATSSAAAQASWFAARVASRYPELWPETIRALMVHSASWTDEMIDQVGADLRVRRDVALLMKVFGYGVPSLESALYTTENNLTYVAEQYIQPFAFKTVNGARTSQTESNEIHMYNLPWPRDLLLDMGNLHVRLKITLSYFIEPGPGEIGWKDRYRYPSYGLRFDLNNIDEDLHTFARRINAEVRDEDERFDSNSGADRWTLGSTNRARGSVHSDFWDGTAADLATCNSIGIYPVIGWWRERKHLNKVENRARYSLVVSLQTQSEEIDLYTPVQAMIQAQVPIT